jgi:protein-tyrosine-phosphatase
MTRKRVLFLCTGNSARSQMAEAVMRQIAGDRFEVASAGTEPRDRVDADAIATLGLHELDGSRLVPKDISTFAGERFDFVITLCERAREKCPAFPGAELIQWSFVDPAALGPGVERRRAFEQVFQGLNQRIRLFVIVNEKA